MEECFKCGISCEKTNLFEVISIEGIVGICEKCFSGEDLPLVRRPTTLQLKEAESKQTVYSRLSNQSRSTFIPPKKNEGQKTVFIKKETTLRDLVEKNLELDYAEKPPRNLALIDNFHWILMRARRLKHVTKSQLAREIGESESVISMAERGILPRDADKLISKLESYFGIIFHNESVEKKQVDFTDVRPEKKELGFDPFTAQSLTISDLKEMKKKKEAETLGGREVIRDEDEIIDIGMYDEEPFFNKNINLENKRDLEEKPEFVGKKRREDLSSREINDLIFRKK